MKKILSLAVLALCISCNSFQSTNPDLVSLVPFSSSIALRVNDTEQLVDLKQQNLFVKKLVNAPKGQQATDFFASLEELKFDFSQPFWICSNMSGINKVAWMVLQDGPSPAHEAIINGLATSGSSRLYEGIHILKHVADKHTFYIADMNDILMISTDDIMIEESIRQGKLKDPTSSAEAINKLKGMANKKDAFNLFVHPKSSPEWLKQMLHINWETISGASGWMSLDAGFPKNSLILNGISLVQDSLGHSLAWFKGNAAQKLKIFQIVPQGVSGVIAFGMGNALQWHRSYEKWLKHELRYEQYQEHLADYGTETNVVDAFISWIDTECAIFSTELRGSEPEKQIFGLFKARSSKQAMGLLNNFGETVEVYRDLPVSRLKFKNITGTVWGAPFDQLKRPYYTYLGSYILFANDLSGLKTVVNDWYLSNTLGNQEEFNDFMKNFDSQSHVLGYIQNPSFQSWIKHWNGGKSVDTNFTNSFDRAAIQMRVEDDLAYTTLLFEKPPKAASQARVSWSLSLDSSLAGPMHLVKNHVNGSNEILVQDSKHTIYLISNKGQILWKRNLDEAIMGEVQQIDFYKNKKLQLVFNTKSKLHMIDRLGNNVEDYPKTLANPASAGLSLFDYDKNRKYRILIPSGRFITYLDQNGEIVKGWNFEGTADTINRQVRLAQAFGKDFIIVRTKGDELFILNRTGKVRVPVNQQLNLSDNEIYLQKGNSLSQSRLVGTDKNGAQVIVYLDGTIDRLEAETLSPSHKYLQSGSFAVVLNESDLRVEGDGLLNRKKFDSGEFSNLSMIRLADEAFISVLNNEEQKVYLVNGQTEMIEGFPVFGEKHPLLCDLDQDNRPNVVVGGADGTIYNYRVD